ncbi:MAG: SBBP repeat-containing protein [Ignavibacteria bacterium]|nr:SBBP repeat-containing protein [Ignavibacteria bacterium]
MGCRIYNGPETYNDRANSIAIDDSGNVYVTGETDYNNSVSAGYATIKYNSEGIQQWLARYNGSNSNPFLYFTKSIVLDRSGNVYVTGRGTPIKYSPSGVEQWIGNGINISKSIFLDSSGNVYVTGHGSGNEGDYETKKYNSSGVQQWARYTGPIYTDQAKCDGCG